jgi:hypothetical protein
MKLKSETRTKSCTEWYSETYPRIRTVKISKGATSFGGKQHISPAHTDARQPMWDP